jgi:hypothetical protein
MNIFAASSSSPLGERGVATGLDLEFCVSKSSVSKSGVSKSSVSKTSVSKIRV